MCYSDHFCVSLSFIRSFWCVMMFCRLPGGSGCASSRSGSSGSQGGAAVARCQPFLLRVLRAALPLQLLLLLIVGLTCLVPMTEQDYSCAHANNFARSFHPMLRYTNGPPPVWAGGDFTNAFICFILHCRTQNGLVLAKADCSCSCSYCC